MWVIALDIVILLVVANGAPILTARLFGSKGDLSIDLGRRLADGRPVFGASKTWRGLMASLLACALCAPLLGYSAIFGLLIGCMAMSGDLISSFLKRRRGLNPSDQSLGLDQIPEALLPCIYAVTVTGLPWWWMVVLPLCFMLLELIISRPLYWLKIRKRPY